MLESKWKILLKYWSKDWFLKHGLVNSIQASSQDAFTLETHSLWLVYRLLVGTAGGNWGRVVQFHRDREDTPWDCNCRAGGFLVLGRGTPWRKTLLQVLEALDFRQGGWGEPCPQQDAAGGTLKSPSSYFLLHSSVLRTWLLNPN